MKLFTRKFLLLLILSLSTFSVSSALTANFTADVTAGCAPLVVNFHNTTTPIAGTTFDWVGVGTGVVHLTDVSGSYLTPGTYTITLTAHNGSSTSAHSITITVYPSPTVSFSASDTTICPGTSVTFTSTSTGGVPGPMTCTWNFGDGYSGTGNPIAHTYSASGFYNVTLSVTNSDGCISSLTKVAYIDVYTPSFIIFTAGATYFCKAPGHAVFTNLTTGFGALTYLWKFGDGSPPSAVTNPTHDYTASGIYTVTLIVTDGHGCTDSAVIPAYITVGHLHASFTYPSTACVNTMVTFTNTGSPHVSRVWTYGDGGSDTSYNGANMYHTPGTYTVTLAVYDDTCYDTISRTITIIPGPTASFTISPLHPCPPPTTLIFTPTAPPGTTISWLYGDGTSGTSSSHLYGRRGVDTIKMIAIGPTGCRDTVTQLDTLYDMIHWITANPLSGCKPLPVNFSATVETNEPDTAAPPYVYPFPVTSYSWNFGDGSPASTAPTPTHTYTAVGIYTVILTFTTGNGCTIYDTIQIQVGTPPAVTFIATPTHECYHSNWITFVATIVTGPVDLFVWQFGDGGSLITSFPAAAHSYGYPGIFTATLTPYYHGCPGPPYVFTTPIIIDSPKSVIYDSVFCSLAKRVQFRDSSIGDDTHLWIFGDGATSTLANPLHDYPLAITYTVTLTTYNVRSGCRDTVAQIIDLSRPIPGFFSLDTAICRDSIVVLHATVTGGVAVAYWWHIQAISADSTSSTSIDTFHTPGIYTVRLIIEDQNFCFDTAIRTNYILVAKPVAHFTVAPPTGCWPLTAVFSDASTDVTGTFFTHFSWDFGDGGSAYVITPSVSHTYTSTGTFTTTEIVTDNIGCKDTVTLPSVTVWRPSAVFTCSNVHPCRIDSTQFINTSTGIVGSFWMFGDGGTSSLNSPWHRYTAVGSYTVKLVVTDVHGCTDTATHINYISVTQPTASFYMNDSVSICPPLMVIFNNTSIGGVFNYWTLGDGSASTLPAPSDLYITTGSNTIRLIVTNRYGCRDTAYGHVTIFGYAGAFSYFPDSGCAPLLVHFHAAILNVPNIIWDYADGITSSVSFTDTISHYYMQPGKYLPKLILSDNTGCQNSSIGIDTIKVDAVYPGFTTIPNPVCLGDTFTMVDTSKSYFSTIAGWNWAIDGNTSIVPSSSFFINGVGSYPATLTVTDGWGCTATITSDVKIYAPPDITVSADTIICVGDAATLTGYGGVSYTWSPAATLSCTNCNPTNAAPPVVTTYTVTGKDARGCTNTDTVSVFLKTTTVSIARGDTEICAGTPVPLFDSGGTKYTWIPATGLSDPHAAEPIATPFATTKYLIIAQLAGCIPDTNYVTVIVHPLPTVDAGPDQWLIAGSVARLNAKGWLITKYLWDNSATLSCDTCANPVASMMVTTTYTVTVTSDFGCLNSDTVTIHLFCNKSQVFVPNSFTPNGDGQNDVFYPRGTGVSKIKSFRIYNRWGQLLFERSDIDINDESNAWDGSYNGGTPRPDVYVYVIDAICETGEPIFIKGDVTIIR